MSLRSGVSSGRRKEEISSTSSPATTRRLMKEWQTILESDRGSAGQDSNSSGKGSQSGRPIPKKNKSGGSTLTNSQGAEVGSAALEDLLELRPWDADGEDLYEWYAKIRGPKEGCYSGGEFELSIQIPPSYPTKPPKMWFKTRIWHPNVHFKTGEICLDLLSSQWSPAWTLSSLCTAIVVLLDSPEPSSPLNVDAANVLRTEDQVAYRSMCQMYTKLHATPAVVSRNGR